MRYRLISSIFYGDNMLKRYPLLDRFDIEAVSDSNMDTQFYITIDTIEDLRDLMNYVGAIVIDNYVVNPRWYYEPTIEIYDGPRE